MNFTILVFIFVFSPHHNFQRTRVHFQLKKLNAVFFLSEPLPIFHIFTQDFLSHHLCEFESEFNALCNHIDKDYNEQIDLHEFANALPTATVSLFAKLDKNHDSVLSIEEFRQMFIKPDGSKDLNSVRKMKKQVSEKIQEVFKYTHRHFTHVKKKLNQ